MHGPGRLTSNSASYACRVTNNLPPGDARRCSGNAISARHLHRLVELTVLGVSGNPAWQQALRAAYQAARAEAAAEATDLGAELARQQAQMNDLREEKRRTQSESRRAAVDRDIDDLDARIAQMEQLCAAPVVTATSRSTWSPGGSR